MNFIMLKTHFTLIEEATFEVVDTRHSNSNVDESVNVIFLSRIQQTEKQPAEAIILIDADNDNE